MAPHPSEIIVSVSSAVRRGKSNAEIVATHPTVPVRTLKTYAALARRRQNIPPLKNASVAPVILAGVLKGLTNAELIAAHPDLKPNSIRGVAARLRSEHGVRAAFALRQSIKIPVELARVLNDEAIARGSHRDGGSLALRLLAIVVRDDLIDAVLDNENPRGPA